MCPRARHKIPARERQSWKVTQKWICPLGIKLSLREKKIHKIYFEDISASSQWRDRTSYSKDSRLNPWVQCFHLNICCSTLILRIMNHFIVNIPQWCSKFQIWYNSPKWFVCWKLCLCAAHHWSYSGGGKHIHWQQYHSQCFIIGTRQER